MDCQRLVSKVMDLDSPYKSKRFLRLRPTLRNRNLLLAAYRAICATSMRFHLRVGRLAAMDCLAVTIRFRLKKLAGPAEPVTAPHLPKK